MLEIRRTNVFVAWMKDLRDQRAKARITLRIDRMTIGNLGDVKPIGEGVSEMRIDYGPGYRIYFCRRGKEIVMLLCGGDKGSQDRDIRAAKRLAAKL